MKLITSSIRKALDKTPYKSQDGKGLEAKVIARYFRGNMTAYVLESEGDTKVFGLVDLGDGFEYGSFDLADYEKINKRYIVPVERDIYVKPFEYTLAECFAIYQEADRYIR